MRVKPVHWLARIGWALGALDCLMAVLLLLFMFIFSGLNKVMVLLLWLLLPVGLTGLVLSLLAFFQIKEDYPQERKRAKLGITFGLIGTLLGSLWFLMAGLILRA